MDEYDVVFARPARKELEALAEDIQDRVLVRVVTLATEPRPSGCKKLSGSGDLWRLRVGDYRVVYSINDTQRLIDVIAVRHRSEAYR